MATKTFDIKDSNKMLDSMDKDFEAILLGIAVELQDRMIDKAPKLSGSLRNSIRVGVNSEEIVYEKGASDDGVKAINESVLRSNFKTGDVVNIIVGAPYGEKMENGSSDQAPSGYMASTAEELTTILQQVESQMDRYRKN